MQALSSRGLLGHRSNPRHGEPGGGGAAADQARGGDSAAGRPAAEQAPPRGTAACTVTPRVRARARLRPPRPARRAAAHRARSASGLPPRPPARGCWAGAGAGAAPFSRGLLVPCARSAAGRPAAPSPPLAWCCAAAAGFAIARVAAVAPRVGFSKHSEHPFFCRTKLAAWGKTDPALFYSTASFTRTKLTGPKSTGPVGRPLAVVVLV